MQSTLINDLMLTRRRALTGLGMLTTSAAAISGSALAAKPTLSAKTRTGPQTLDYQDPKDNLYAFGKIWAGFAEPVYGAYHGIMYARIPGKRHMPLFGYVGTGVLQAKFNEDGNLHLRGKETGFFTDLAFTKVLDAWQNPFTGETVKPFDFFNTIGGILTSEMPRYDFGTKDDEPTLMNEGSHIEKDGTIPFILPFEFYGDDALLAWDYAHAYTNPVTPEKWPKASTGSKISPSEHFTFRVSKAELENRDIPSARSMTGFSRVSEWWPWMMMGGNEYQNGTLYGRMFSHKGLSGYQDIPPYLLAHIEKHHPDSLQVPDQWLNKRPMGTWEKYAASVPPEVST